MNPLIVTAKRCLPPATLARLRIVTRRLGLPRWGNLRRLEPFSSYYGFDRGTPVDRYYLNRFLEAHTADVRGDVLEIQESTYTRRYGSELRSCHTIDLNPRFSPTYLCDLAAADVVPSDRYDCFLLPNTLCVLRDIRACLRQALRVVKPGGVVLATTAALGQVEQDGSDYWRLSPAGWKEVAAEVWAGHDFTIEGHGNCVTAMAALLGLALEELRQGELDAQDGRYPVLVTLFCRKIGPR